MSSIPLSDSAKAYAKAAKELIDALPSRSSVKSLQGLESPEFDTDESIQITVEKLSKFLESFSRKRNEYKGDPRRKAKAKRLVEDWFNISVPFAKAFLQAGRVAVSLVVCPIFPRLLL